MIAEFVLRLGGAFYAAAAFAGLARIGMDMMLDEAIAALKPGTDKPALRATRLRALMLLGVLLSTGAAGLLALVKAEPAFPAFVFCCALNAVNLLMIAPRFVDPFDPPGTGARTRSFLALGILCAFAVLAGAMRNSGALQPVAEVHPMLLALAATGGLGLLWRAARMWRLGRGGESGLGGSSATKTGFSAAPIAGEFPETGEEAQFALFRNVRLVLAPETWDNVLHTAADFAALPDDTPVEELDDDDKFALSLWRDRVRAALDPDDPSRTRFIDDDSRRMVEAEGQALFERLRQKLGDRITYEAAPRPARAKIEAPRLIVKARSRYWPIYDPREPDRAIAPAWLALSIQLENDFNDWSLDYDDAAIAAETSNPVEAPDWTASEREKFERRGRELARRLTQELAAKGRADTLIEYAAAD